MDGDSAYLHHLLSLLIAWRRAALTNGTSEQIIEIDKTKYLLKTGPGFTCLHTIKRSRKGSESNR